MREFAVDDYKAIRERMEQLSGKSQPNQPDQPETSSEARVRVGKELNCRSFHYNAAIGCPKGTNYGGYRACQAAGECLTDYPR